MNVLRSLLKPAHGGAYLPDGREHFGGGSAKPLAAPAMLVVPLRQHDGPVAQPIVEVGHRVKAGQLIGRPAGADSLAIHAPLSGRVLAIQPVDTAAAADVPAIWIRTAAEQPPSGWRYRGLTSLPTASADVGALADLADEAGLPTFQEPALALGQVLREARRLNLRHLIINGLQTEPLIGSAEYILDEHLETCAEMARRLGAALGVKRTWFPLAGPSRNRLRRARQACASAGIRLASLERRYPQHAPILLTAALTRREAPPGGRPQDVGVLVLELAAVLGLAAALAHHARGERAPLTDRVVTVAGGAVARPGEYRIALGTRFADVLEQVGLRETAGQVIEGGPMTGRAVDSLDVVVTSRTTAILALPRRHDRVPEPGPCVRCGWCQEDCPVGINPQAILDCRERTDWKAAAALHAEACIGCGLCSYVCPVDLPLAEGLADVKAVLRAGPSAGKTDAANG